MSDPLRRSRRTTGVGFPDAFDLGGTLLRRLRLADAEAVFERYAADPEVTRWLTFRAHRDVDDARAFCATMEAEWEAGRTYAYALRRWHVAPNLSPEPPDCLACAKVR